MRPSAISRTFSGSSPRPFATIPTKRSYICFTGFSSIFTCSGLTGSSGFRSDLLSPDAIVTGARPIFFASSDALTPLIITPIDPVIVVGRAIILVAGAAT